MCGAVSVTARRVGHQTAAQFKGFDLFGSQQPRVARLYAPQVVQTQRGAQEKRHRRRRQKPDLKKTGEPTASPFPVARPRFGLRPYSRPQTLHRPVAQLLLGADAAQRCAQAATRCHLAPADAAALRMAEHGVIGLDRQLTTEIGIEQLFEILAIHSSHRATEPQREEDKGTRGQGDKGTRGRRKGKQEIALPLSSSPLLLVSPSPCHLVFLSVFPLPSLFSFFFLSLFCSFY